MLRRNARSNRRLCPFMGHQRRRALNCMFLKKLVTHRKHGRSINTCPRRSHRYRRSRGSNWRTRWLLIPHWRGYRRFGRRNRQQRGQRRQRRWRRSWLDHCRAVRPPLLLLLLIPNSPLFLDILSTIKCIHGRRSRRIIDAVLGLRRDPTRDRILSSRYRRVLGRWGERRRIGTKQYWRLHVRGHGAGGCRQQRKSSGHQDSLYVGTWRAALLWPRRRAQAW